MTVADGTSANLEPRLLNGQLDLAVVSLPVVGDELVATPLFEEDLMLVVPVDHPLASGPCPLPLAALTELDLVLPLPNTALRDDIDRALRHAGVTLHPAIELDGIRMIASLTFDGFGPAILPATAVPRPHAGAVRPGGAGGLPAPSGRRRAAPPGTPLGTDPGGHRTPQHGGQRPHPAADGPAPPVGGPLLTLPSPSEREVRPMLSAKVPLDELHDDQDGRPHLRQTAGSPSRSPATSCPRRAWIRPAPTS